MATEKLMQFTIKQGMNQDILKSYPDNYFDSIVTDPPYGIEFLGKDWDSNTGAIETWQQCYRVLKPGGHILAFSAARTYHNLATNIESVGFEIRDQLMWIYASGFPKAQDIGKAIDKRAGAERKIISVSKNDRANSQVKGGMGFDRTLDKGQEHQTIYETAPATPEAQQWSGWKTALKPAHEPIVMARKPFKGSCIDNVLTHGTGALNIDATRIGDEVREIKDIVPIRETSQFAGKANNGKDGNGFNYKPLGDKTYVGRFPSNVFGEIPDYQKYFYCPKVSRAERHIGFESVPEPEKFNNPDEMKKHPLWDPSIGTNSHRLMTKIREHGYTQDGSLDHIPTIGYNGGDAMGQLAGSKSKQLKNIESNTASLGNNHPTVKPVALMSYLVKLVTPEGGRVLDPFNGSGSTGMACVQHGFDYTGCELDPNYVAIATKRINGWYAKTQPDNNFKELFDASK